TELERTTLPLLAGPYLPRNLQRTVTEIRGPHGKSVPRRPVERRLIPVSMNRLCQHAIFGGQQRYPFCRRHCQIDRVRQHHPERLIEADNASRSLAHLLLLKLFKLKTERPRAASPGARFLFTASISSGPYSSTSPVRRCPRGYPSRPRHGVHRAPVPDTSDKPPRIPEVRRSCSSSDRPLPAESAPGP